MNDHTDLPQNKAELGERIRRAHAELERLIGSLSEAELVAPGPDGGWSIKDHLAHLAAWNQKQQALIQGRPPYEGLNIDRQTYLAGDLDQINAILDARNKELSLAEALEVFRNTHLEMLAALERMSEADLNRPNNPGDPDDPRKLVEGIIANTYEHDQEHLGWIEQILESRHSE